jgi:indole-3-glycerol phosphate synthase
VEGNLRRRSGCYDEIPPMLQTVPDILARIVEQRGTELAHLARRRDELEREAEASRASRRDFSAELGARQIAVIAEIKKSSPSRGLLTADFDPVTIARTYETAGAASISVLTDGPHFGGSLQDLRAARDAVRIPVLRKDFTIAPEHVLEAAANGADAILLIAALLTESEMRNYRELAESFAMAALVEVHDAEELQRAASSGARIIGVNNRDLRTFEVSLETSLRLAELMPAGVLRVAESGIHSGADVRRLKDAGYNAFLVGEYLMKAADPAAALRELLV